MIARRSLRSLAARAPWLVFAVLPPLAVVALLAGASLMMAALWALLPEIHNAPPPWAHHLAAIWCAAACLSAGPLTAVALAIVAVRQRLTARWVLFSAAIAGFVGAFTIFIVRLPVPGKHGELSFGFGATPATLGDSGSRFALTLVAVLTAYILLQRRQRALA